MSFFSIQLSEILKYIDLHFPNGWRNTFLFARSKVPKAIMFFLVWGTQSSNLDFRGENPQSQSSRMKAEGNTRLGHTKSSLRLWMLKLSSFFFTGCNIHVEFQDLPNYRSQGLHQLESKLCFTLKIFRKNPLRVGEFEGTMSVQNCMAKLQEFLQVGEQNLLWQVTLATISKSFQIRQSISKN